MSVFGITGSKAIPLDCGKARIDPQQMAVEGQPFEARSAVCVPGPLGHIEVILSDVDDVANRIARGDQFVPNEARVLLELAPANWWGRLRRKVVGAPFTLVRNGLGEVNQNRTTLGGVAQARFTGDGVLCGTFRGHGSCPDTFAGAFSAPLLALDLAQALAAVHQRPATA